jgi:DNA-binding transcriptional LysR family regulator
MSNSFFDKLDYLEVLAEEKNITRASEKLFISQPALTAFFNRIEEDLKIKLFDRSHTPITITPAGVFYISEMEKLRNQYNQLAHNLQQMSYDPEMTLSVGIGRNRGSIWLPHILPVLYQQFPNIHLQITEDRDENMADKVTHNVLDLAIIESYIPNPALNYISLFDESYVLITGKSNPLAEEVDLAGNDRHHPADISVDKLNNQIFICPSLKGGLNRYTQQLFSTFSINPKEILYITNAHTAYQLAVKGIGVTCLCDAYQDIILMNEKPVFLMPGGKPAVRKIFAVYSMEKPRKLMTFFLECIRKTLINL